MILLLKFMKLKIDFIKFHWKYHNKDQFTLTTRVKVSFFLLKNKVITRLSCSKYKFSKEMFFIINGKLNYYCRFRTFTYSSFNWIYDDFYPVSPSGKKGRKVVPIWIEEYLSPKALAIWIMDDGGWINNRGLKLSTNSFKLEEVKVLKIFHEKKIL